MCGKTRLDEKLIRKIQELNSKGLSISQIAKELNISRATVRKYRSVHDDDNQMVINDTEGNPPPDEEYNPPAPSSFPPDPKTKAQWAYWEFREAQSKQKKADLKKNERSLLNELLITILRLKYTAQDQASTVYLIHNIEISPDLKKHALKWGNMDSNRKTNQRLTLEEERKLLDACVIYVTRKDNIIVPHYWLQEIVTVALNTGMRQDEILSLRWPDVDLFRKTITIMRSKNGEKRTIPMNQKVFELLKIKAKVRNIRDNHVFPSEAGTKIHDRNLRRGFYDALEKAGITDFKFHDLRHTFATRLVQANVDLYTVSKLLGHKDIKMSQRYAHHCPESLRGGVEVLDKISTILAQSNEKGLQQNAATP